MLWFWRTLRWTGALVFGLAALLFVQNWVWWQVEPQARGTATNGLWARHQWVGQAHTEAEYQAFAALVRQNRISDVFFHTGPLEADGSVPPWKYAHAWELTSAMRRLAPEVRIQAYLGQIRSVLRLDDPTVRDRIVETGEIMIGLGFDGLHYDIEPVRPDDAAFLDLLDRTRPVTKLLSVSIEQLTLVDPLSPLLRKVPGYPARPTGAYLRKLAARSDQVAIMTYDTALPTGSTVGRHFAWHTEQTLKLIGDRTTVFIGVPTYAPQMHWSEDLPTALRGVRRGIDALPRQPLRPYGVAIYPEWTTSPREWAQYRAGWPS
ncbi:MAG: hypothetical protein ABIQ26_23850 [Streptosporangiaceae bacterium]